MKKITLVLFLSLIVASACLFCRADTVYAEENYADRFYYYLNDFVGKNPKREAFTQNEHSAGEYISDLLSGFGYNISRQEFTRNYSGYYSETTQLSSFNVIATKKTASSKKTAVLGAHYDASTSGTGAFDNGSGVAVLLTVAEAMKDVKLDYNLQFVFFGAEEPGLIGSQEFANSLDSGNVLVYINFDVCVGGDKLFVYCEDVKTPQLDFFAKVIDECNADIEARVDMKPVFVSSSINPYYIHIGMRSDNQSFKNKGIPTVDFFSGSLDNSFGVYVENPDGSSVMHTSADNLTYFSNNENKVRNQAEFLVKTVVNSLTKSDFEYTMCNATMVSENVTSYRYPLIAFAVLNLIAIAVVLLLNGRNKRDATFGDLGAKEKKEMFSAPKDDDVFEFRK